MTRTLKLGNTQGGHPVRLSPTPIRYEDIDGFAGTDLFGRNEFGKGLANIVLNVEEPLVISLEAPWGAGKTTFIHQWRRYLESQDGGNLACIYFDAFKSDFYGDAFLTLAAELHQFAVENIPAEDPGIQDLKTGAIKLGKVLGKSALKTITQVIPFGDMGSKASQTFADEVSLHSD